MQAFARIANQAGQAVLNIEVYIFQIQRPGEGAAFDFAQNLRHATFDIGKILGVNDVLFGQHARMGQRATNVLLPEALVKINGSGISLDELRHGFVKAARPSVRGCGGVLFVG